jgi:hypothetical protein
MIWLLLVQSLSQHINLHAEELRSKFVDHEGKQNILVRRNNFVKGSAENNWSSVFDEFSIQIRENIGVEIHDILTANFSTTTPTEKAASEIVLMEAMQNYFSYTVRTCCGFPWIELQGEVQDWVEIKNRVQKFTQFGLENWAAVLLPILNEFILTAEGKVNQTFWQSFFKSDGGSGGPYINGWVNVFFLYLNHQKQNKYALSWKSDGCFDGVNPDRYLSGISVAPFVWEYFDQKFDMEFLAGFCGFTQRDDNAILPVIGWAVRDK